MCLLQEKVSTYFQMLAETVHDPPGSDPFLCFLKFQVPFLVSLVAFSFQKFHFPPKKIPKPANPTNYLPTGHSHIQVDQHKLDYCTVALKSENDVTLPISLAAMIPT